MMVSEEPKMIVSDINIIYKPEPKRAHESNVKSSPVAHFKNINLRNGKKLKNKIKIKKKIGI